MDADAYVESFRPYLMDAAYAWSRGASFAEVMHGRGQVWGRVSARPCLMDAAYVWSRGASFAEAGGKAGGCRGGWVIPEGEGREYGNVLLRGPGKIPSRALGLESFLPPPLLTPPSASTPIRGGVRGARTSVS